MHLFYYLNILYVYSFILFYYLNRALGSNLKALLTTLAIFQTYQGWLFYIF